MPESWRGRKPYSQEAYSLTRCLLSTFRLDPRDTHPVVPCHLCSGFSALSQRRCSVLGVWPTSALKLELSHTEKKINNLN